MAIFWDFCSWVRFYDLWLVGGLEHFFIFPYIENLIIPTDELIFFRGVGLNHQPEKVSPVKQSQVPLNASLKKFCMVAPADPG